jgi:hypothetical protein
MSAALFATGWQDGLLLTRRAAPVTLEPFPYFVVDDYLPPALYTAARAAFPAGVETDQYGNRKQVFSQHRHPERVAEFLAGDEVWRTLVEFFGSDVYLQDLRRYLGPGRSAGAGPAPSPSCRSSTGRSRSATSSRCLRTAPISTRTPTRRRSWSACCSTSRPTTGGPSSAARPSSTGRRTGAMSAIG